MLTAKTTINASPIEIFQYWEDTESWYLWNGNLLNFSLPHGFSYGSKGWLVGPSGRRWRFSLVHFDYPNSFTAEFAVPFGRLLVQTHFRIWQGQTEVTIESRFTGLLTSFYKRFYGYRIQVLMRSTLDDLKQAAEQGLNPGQAARTKGTIRPRSGAANERHSDHTASTSVRTAVG